MAQYDEVPPNEIPPLGDYVFKLLLLEIVKCRVREDAQGFVWVRGLMFSILRRWEELSGDNGK
jgi:hypothetical protein